MKVEVILAWEYGDWTTEVVHVDDSEILTIDYNPAQILSLAMKHFDDVSYRKVVYFGVYSYWEDNEDQ